MKKNKFLAICMSAVLAASAFMSMGASDGTKSEYSESVSPSVTEKSEPTESTLPDWLPQSAAEAETFMIENGTTTMGMVETTTVARDNMVCSIIYINGADSTRSDNICLTENSDVKAPVSYEKYRDKHYGDYIVACFEMPPDSFLEIYDTRYYPEVLGTYVSNGNGRIKKVLRGDVNMDNEFNIADVAVLRKWLLGDSFYGGNIELVNWKAADLCVDGRLDVFDLRYMKELLLKNEVPTELPSLDEISEMSNEEAYELLSRYTFQDIECIWGKFDYYFSGLYGGGWTIGDNDISLVFDYYTRELESVCGYPVRTDDYYIRSLIKKQIDSSEQTVEQLTANICSIWQYDFEKRVTSVSVYGVDGEIITSGKIYGGTVVVCYDEDKRIEFEIE